MITGRRRIVAPTLPVVTLAEIQRQTRVDTVGSPPVSAEDAELLQYVQAATDDMEGEDGWIGRAFMPQTWRVSFRDFPVACNKNPDAALFLPYPPLLEVTSVHYTDGDGTLTLMSPAEYETVIDGDPHGYVRPLFNQSWPSVGDRNDAVRVTFRCGYDDTVSPPNPLPAAIKQYVLVLAALMYDNRELDAVNVNIQPIANFHAAAQRFRVYGP